MSEKFEYSYSAKEKEEIEKIRQKYLPKEENKMEQLRRLDESTTIPGKKAAIITGIFGASLFGIGMTAVLEWRGIYFIPGIVIGVIGLLFMGAAYPLYQRITERKRKEIAPEILKLTDALKKEL